MPDPRSRDLRPHRSLQAKPPLRSDGAADPAMAARPGDLGEGLRGQPMGGPEPLPLLITANRGRDAEVGRDVQVGFNLSNKVALHEQNRQADQAGEAQTVHAVPPWSKG